jgi:hypothetical protein
MSPKDFLFQECQNVKSLLDKTLRYDYGIDGSRHFFEECSVRLEGFQVELESLDGGDLSMLEKISDGLNELAKLICRIERSSLDEYSWPFVEELKKLFLILCQENTIHRSPEVYVLAEGGLTSYAIYPEDKRPSVSKKQLLTVVFPKSLKNFVLLHAILAHELGHAVWRVLKNESTLRQPVSRFLNEAGGNLANPKATAAHLYSQTPPNVWEYLIQLGSYSVNQDNIFANFADWRAWVEEVVCDLIGLVIFGPGFVAAHCRLLYTADPTGVSVGRWHPLVAWRVNMVLKAAELLGYDQLPSEKSTLRAPMEVFWQYVNSFRKEDVWYDFLSRNQLGELLGIIRNLFKKYPQVEYQKPLESCIEDLWIKVNNLIPPVGHKLKADSSLINVNVDFRHIIYVGWIAEAALNDGNKKFSFQQINQLCEHAIMQQKAIDIVLEKEFFNECSCKK